MAVNNLLHCGACHRVWMGMWKPGKKKSQNGSWSNVEEHRAPDIRQLRAQLIEPHDECKDMGYYGVWAWVEGNPNIVTWPVWPMCTERVTYWKDPAALSMHRLGATWPSLQLYAIELAIGTE